MIFFLVDTHIYGTIYRLISSLEKSAINASYKQVNLLLIYILLKNINLQSSNIIYTTDVLSKCFWSRLHLLRKFLSQTNKLFTNGFFQLDQSNAIIVFTLLCIRH